MQISSRFRKMLLKKDILKPKLAKRNFNTLQVYSKQSMCTSTIQRSESGRNNELIFKSPRGKDRKKYDVKVGDLVYGFTVTEITNIREFNIVSYKLEHEKTGAKYLHLDTEDMENVSKWPNHIL